MSTEGNGNGYGGSPHIPVDTYIAGDLALRPAAGRNRNRFTAAQDELDQCAGPPVYARRVRPDKKAIDNLASLPRPKKPPGRT